MRWCAVGGNILLGVLIDGNVHALVGAGERSEHAYSLTLGWRASTSSSSSEDFQLPLVLTFGFVILLHKNHEEAWVLARYYF